MAGRIVRALKCFHARREPRTQANGELRMEIGDRLVSCSLVDATPHGFAIRHEYEGFVPGQEVRVVYEWGKVAARLVWTNTRQGVMTAGFRTD